MWGVRGQGADLPVSRGVGRAECSPLLPTLPLGLETMSRSGVKEYFFFLQGSDICIRSF